MKARGLEVWDRYTFALIYQLISIFQIYIYFLNLFLSSSDSYNTPSCSSLETKLMKAVKMFSMYMCFLLSLAKYKIKKHSEGQAYFEKSWKRDYWEYTLSKVKISIDCQEPALWSWFSNILEQDERDIASERLCIKLDTTQIIWNFPFSRKKCYNAICLCTGNLMGFFSAFLWMSGFQQYFCCCFPGICLVTTT